MMARSVFGIPFLIYWSGIVIVLPTISFDLTVGADIGWIIESLQPVHCQHVVEHECTNVHQSLDHVNGGEVSAHDCCVVSEYSKAVWLKRVPSDITGGALHQATLVLRCVVVEDPCYGLDELVMNATSNKEEQHDS